MEGRANRQEHGAARTRGLGQLHGAGDGRRMARDHRLVRRIQVRGAHHLALGGLLDRLDEEVIAAGGREYLAKDSRLPASAVERMYPRLDEWRGVRRAADPDGVFTSDLARRLGL